MPSAVDMRNAAMLWEYLRLGKPAEPTECLLVFGGHDLGVADRAADLYVSGITPLVVVSGGSRAVPDGSDFATEADAIADVLLSRDVPKEAIVLERLASNTSENFWLSAELLRDLGLDPHTFLVVHKPYSERRTLATARRRWPDKRVDVTSQQISFDDYCAGEIPVDRILSMLAGEALRLESYAATGLIKLDEPVPADLLSAARALQEAGFNTRPVPRLTGPDAACVVTRHDSGWPFGMRNLADLGRTRPRTQGFAIAASKRNHEWMSNSSAADPRELQSFIARGGQVRLVKNQWTDKLEGVAFRRPDAWDWQELPVEGPAEKVISKTFVNLVTQLVEQSLPGIAPPTSMDQALEIASTAVEKTSPQDIAGKLANIAGQTIACHVGCVAVARQVGAVLQAVVVSMPFPASPAAEALNAATIGVVAFDLKDARLTPTVMDLFVGMGLPEIDGPAIPRRQLRAIGAAQQSSRRGLPQPGEEPPDSGELPRPDREELTSSPSPTSQPGANEQSTPRRHLRRRSPGNR